MWVEAKLDGELQSLVFVPVSEEPPQCSSALLRPFLPKSARELGIYLMSVGVGPENWPGPPRSQVLTQLKLQVPKP